MFGQIIEGDYQDPCNYDDWDIQVQRSEILIDEGSGIRNLTREIHSNGIGQHYIDQRHQTFDSSGGMISEVYKVQGVIYHRELLETGQWQDWSAADSRKWDFHEVPYPLYPAIEPAEFIFPREGQYDERSSFCGLVPLDEATYRGIETIERVELRRFTGTLYDDFLFAFDIQESYIQWEFWVDRSGKLRQSRTVRGLDEGEAVILTKVSYPDEPITIVVPFDSGIPTLPGDNPSFLEEYQFTILLVLWALIPMGTVGFFCGLIFSNLSWWSWTFIGMLAGVVSMVLSSLVLQFVFETLFVGADNATVAAYVRFAVNLFGNLVLPMAVLIGLAWTINNWKANRGAESPVESGH